VASQPDRSQLDRRALARARDRAAADFARRARLHQEICERMAERLQYLKIAPQTILQAGSDAGCGTRKLSAAYGQASVVTLDVSLEMLRAGAPKRGFWRSLAARDAVNGHLTCGSLDALPFAAESFDMVWSNLFLPWYDATTVIAELRRVMKPNALLMMSTFGPDTLKEFRQACVQSDARFGVLPFVDMHDLGDALSHGGFTDPVADMEMLTFTHERPEDLLHDLRASGSCGMRAGRDHSLAGKTAWRQLCRSYDAMREAGGLPATFEIVYVQAWRGAERARPTGEQVVRFDRPARKVIG
jgi:malonyl-CoA O-methyltransferase